MKVIDMAFSLSEGAKIRVDHSYSVFAALSHFSAGIHGAEHLGIHSINGLPDGNGFLILQSHRSRLTLRTELTMLPELLKLAGKSLMIDQAKITLGVPTIALLEPAKVLFSRLVTIKGFTEPDTFAEAVNRQLARLVTTSRPTVDVVKRRILRIKGQKIVGFSLVISGLEDEDSLEVQRIGIGGRRHLGCGLFIKSSETNQPSRASHG